MSDDDEMERKVNEAFDEADPLGAEMRRAGFREVLPGDDGWDYNYIQVAETSDPIRIVWSRKP